MNRVASLLRKARLAVLVLALFAYALPVPKVAWAESYDVIFRGGEVLDGTGARPYRADVAVREGVIAAIGDLEEETAGRVIDAADLTIVPGFIDIHSHADGIGDGGGLGSRDPKRRAAPNLVSQGVTTVVINQDGRSPLDIARQRRRLEARGFGPNAALMVGHNTVRRAALEGTAKDRPATADEIGAMRAMIREGMEAGAWGLSAGLEYEPGIWSDTEELIEIVREIVPYGGVYIVHERSSGSDPMWFTPSQDSPDPPTMLDSIYETIRIGETTGATVVATHIKARGTNYWGKSREIIDAIEEARARGVKIVADQYPYTSSGSDGTIVLIPRWIFDDFRGDSTDYAGALMHAMVDDSTSQKINGDAAHMIMRRGGPSNIVVLRHPDRSAVGRTLEDLAAERGVSPVEMVFLLQFEGYHDRFGGALLRGFSLNETDVRAFAARPWVATASDAGITLPDDGLIHARYYGTFPRKIRKYALDPTNPVLSVGQAIRSMTSFPAAVMGFQERGRIEVGYSADIVALDLETVRDMATFFEPHQYAKGIPFVMINGTFVVENSAPTFALPGTVLLPPAPRDRRDTDD